jgi:UDP-2-acetamido-2,6-beta-L-arabino-hexul-4-ose reductase
MRYLLLILLVTNNGDDELIVMLWANEIFDHDKPDTIASIIENEKA